MESNTGSYQTPQYEQPSFTDYEKPADILSAAEVYEVSFDSLRQLQAAYEQKNHDISQQITKLELFRHDTQNQLLAKQQRYDEYQTRYHEINEEIGTLPDTLGGTNPMSKNTLRHLQQKMPKLHESIRQLEDLLQVAEPQITTKVLQLRAEQQYLQHALQAIRSRIGIDRIG